LEGEPSPESEVLSALEQNIFYQGSICTFLHYRPPSANNQYLDNMGEMCEMLDNVCDINREVHFLDALHIDWLS
jgi:hypothetical protein